MNFILLTSDSDWAHAEIIQEEVDILKDYNYPLTLFLTNYSKIKERNLKIEYGIHPNFDSADTDSIILNLINQIPLKIKGLRSHRLLIPNNLYEVCLKHGIKYTSNKLGNLNPFYIENKILEIPIYFADDLFMQKCERLALNELKMENALEVLVFLFHPVHIYLNTPTFDYYEGIKNITNWHEFYTSNPSQLEKYINSKNRGTRDFFIDFLNTLEELNARYITCFELLQLWKEKTNEVI